MLTIKTKNLRKRLWKQGVKKRGFAHPRLPYQNAGASVQLLLQSLEPGTCIKALLRLFFFKTCVKASDIRMLVRPVDYCCSSSTAAQPPARHMRAGI